MVERTGYLPRILDESSGVAVSRLLSGVLWSHNDSGGDNYIYAISLAGERLGSYRVVGADNRDWEDIALGKCPYDTGHCLYIADTGNNSGRRRRVSLYVLPEPTSLPQDQTKALDTDRAMQFELRFPDGPLDIEALAVGAAGQIFLVSKGRHSPARVYLIPADSLVRGGETVAHALADAETTRLRAAGRWVTGAAISPSGERLVIRNNAQLFFYRLLPNDVLAADGEPCTLGAIEPQGEAVDFLDEETVVLTSETVIGIRGPITRVVCPD